MEHQFCVATDASNYSIGGVLYQIINNEYRYIGFAARSLSQSERNYCTTKRELLGMVFMLKRYHQFLWGRRFKLYTDHKSLCYIHTQPIANPMMIGWQDVINDHVFDVVHCPGVKNVLPDALSRLFEDDASNSNLVGGASSKTNNSKATSSTSINTAQITNDRPEYMTPPETHRPILLRNAHLLGHFGANAIVTTIHNDGYHWVNLKQEALDLVSQCPECRLFNIGKHGYLPLRSIKSDAPGDHWAMDLGTLNVTSHSCNNFILVLVDAFSRFCILRAIPDKSALTIVLVLKQVFCDFGFPKIVQSDRGSEFDNQLVKLLLTNCGIDHRLVLPYNPRSNGLAEKWVHTVKSVVIKRLQGAKVDWELYLSSTQYALNCKYAAIHKSRPYSIMFGRQPNEFNDYSEVESESHEPNSEHMNSLKSKVDGMAKVVIPAIKQRIETSQVAEQEKFKKSHRIVLQYPLGSQVMLVKDFALKSDEKYEGTYYVNGITKNKAYILRNHAGVLYLRDIPINQLKLISGDLPANGKENEHYKVQAVVDHKPDPRNIGQYLYLVNWKGYSDNDNTWEPIANFDNRTCVRDY